MSFPVFGTANWGSSVTTTPYAYIPVNSSSTIYTLPVNPNNANLVFQPYPAPPPPYPAPAGHPDSFTGLGTSTRATALDELHSRLLEDEVKDPTLWLRRRVMETLWEPSN